MLIWTASRGTQWMASSDGMPGLGVLFSLMVPMVGFTQESCRRCGPFQGLPAIDPKLPIGIASVHGLRSGSDEDYRPAAVGPHTMAVAPRHLSSEVRRLRSAVHAGTSCPGSWTARTNPDPEATRGRDRDARATADRPVRPLTVT